MAPPSVPMLRKRAFHGPFMWRPKVCSGLRGRRGLTGRSTARTKPVLDADTSHAHRAHALAPQVSLRPEDRGLLASALTLGGATFGDSNLGGSTSEEEEEGAKDSVCQQQ